MKVIINFNKEYFLTILFYVYVSTIGKVYQLWPVAYKHFCGNVIRFGVDILSLAASVLSRQSYMTVKEVQGLKRPGDRAPPEPAEEKPDAVTGSHQLL